MNAHYLCLDTYVNYTFFKQNNGRMTQTKFLLHHYKTCKEIFSSNTYFITFINIWPIKVVLFNMNSKIHCVIKFKLGFFKYFLGKCFITSLQFQMKKCSCIWLSEYDVESYMYPKMWVCSTYVDRKRIVGKYTCM